MFSESIRHFHPDITEQSVSELREFLVTAQQRHQSDSQTLSMGLQAVKQEALDEGFDWNDLFTNLVELLSADMHKDQHERFVAELDSLNSNNSSLLEVGNVMKADYPSVFDGLQLLIQVAQEEHEALVVMAGGTSTKPKMSNAFKSKKAETYEKVAEGLTIAGIGIGASIGVVGLIRSIRKGDSVKWELPKNGFKQPSKGLIDVERKPETSWSHQDFTSSEFNRMENKLPFDEKVDPKSLETETKVDIDKAINEKPISIDSDKAIKGKRFSIDSEDKRLYNELNDEMGSADRTSRVLDRYLEPVFNEARNGDANLRRLSREAERDSQKYSSEISGLEETHSEIFSEFGGIERPNPNPRSSDTVHDAIENETQEVRYAAESEVGQGKEVAEQEIRTETEAVTNEVKADVKGEIEEVDKSIESAAEDMGDLE